MVKKISRPEGPESDAQPQKLPLLALSYFLSTFGPPIDINCVLKGGSA